MHAPLVRERSGVQSSLAAPLTPFEITAFSESVSARSLQLATERNAKTPLNTGKIRGLPFAERSTPPPETKNPAAAGTVAGSHSENLAPSSYPALRAFARYRVTRFLCVEVMA